MKRALCASFCLLVLVQITQAQSTSHITTPSNLSSSTYTGPISKINGHQTQGKVLKGIVQVGIKLQDPPLVVAVGANAKQNGITMTADQQRAYLAQLKQKQDAVMSQVNSLGGVELGRVSKGHNALIVSVDASHFRAFTELAAWSPSARCPTISFLPPQCLTLRRPMPISARVAVQGTAASPGLESASRCSTQASTTHITIWADRESWRTIRLP